MALTVGLLRDLKLFWLLLGKFGKSDGAARSRICLSVKPFANALHILNATHQKCDHRDWKSNQSPHIPQEDVIFANETYRIEELRD
jgi:hypothetical protein